MDRLFFKKNKGVLAGCALIGIACFCLLIASWLAYFSLTGLDNQIRGLEGCFYGDKKANLTQDKDILGSLRNIKESFDKNCAQYASHFLAESLPGEGIPDPLAFKQKLFELQDALEKKADNAEILLPPGLGFAEYELKVPAQAEMENLNKKLMMMQSIVTKLIDNRTVRIQKIEFADASIKSKEAQPKKPGIPFITQIMRLEFESDFKGIEGVMADLAKDESIFVVKKLNIQHLEKEKGILFCSMELEQF